MDHGRSDDRKPGRNFDIPNAGREGNIEACVSDKQSMSLPMNGGPMTYRAFAAAARARSWTEPAAWPGIAGLAPLRAEQRGQSVGPVGPSFYERPPTLDEPWRTNHDRESGKHHRDGKLYVLALTDTKPMGV